MFKSALKLVNDRIPTRQAKESLTDEQWFKFTEECLPHLLVFDDFLPTFELVLGKDLVSGSTEDMLYYHKDYTGISFYRIRPEDGYYINKGKKLPSPADPKGPSATGIEIELGLYEGYEGKNGRPASIDFSFEIWGREERQAFKELFTDYRRIVLQLLSGLDLEFWTSCVFPSVDSYRKRDAGGKLERYLAEEDGESNFSLRRTYYGETDEKEFARIFMVFLILYSSCMNRLTKRGNKDILLEYYLKIR